MRVWVPQYQDSQAGSGLSSQCLLGGGCGEYGIKVEATGQGQYNTYMG